jgi:hypothetical protein
MPLPPPRAPPVAPARQAGPINSAHAADSTNARISGEVEWNVRGLREYRWCRDIMDDLRILGAAG